MSSKLEDVWARPSTFTSTDHMYIYPPVSCICHFCWTPQPLKIKAPCCFEALGNTSPATHCHISEDLDVSATIVETLNLTKYKVSRAPVLWRGEHTIIVRLSWSQWPCSLRRGSTAARLLGLWVRIPPGAWMSVSCECCQVEVSATSWSLVQRSPTKCGVSKTCDREASKKEAA
jgi:hypothetical protein